MMFKILLPLWVREKWHLVLFPLMALVFSSYFLYRYTSQRGVDVVVSFVDAKSIQSEKTRVYYRGVSIGVVNEVLISEDGQKAECRISLDKNAVPFAVEGSVFYLVSPKVGLEGVSGLDTLLSGSYIVLDPGKRGGKTKTSFKGELSKNSIDRENVSSFTIETDHAESISMGDEISFRGISVGVVGGIKLNPTAQKVLVEVLVYNQFTKLIRSNTVFWKKQGIKADLGLFNSKIKINSLDTILRGGIEIATPNPPGPRAKGGTRFPLLSEEPKEREKTPWDPELTFK